jgi:hypothetical protein
MLDEVNIYIDFKISTLDWLKNNNKNYQNK